MLVLLAAGGLAGRVRPAPGVMLALVRHGARPSEASFLRTFAQVTLDSESTRQRMDERWEPFAAYMVDRSCTLSVQRANRRLLRRLGLPAVPVDDLARIRVPTTLIWGRHDRVMKLGGAQHADRRYGWPLHVIESAGHLPHIEQPGPTLRALRGALEAS